MRSYIDLLTRLTESEHLEETTPAGKATKREKLDDAGYRVEKTDAGYQAHAKSAAAPDAYKTNQQAWSACWAHFQYGDWPLV